MNYSVSLLAVMALVILQYSLEVDAQLDSGKMDLDNNLQANVVPTPKKRLRKYVRISIPPPATVHHSPGSKLELECEIMGSPAPVAHWLRNGEPIIEYEDEVNEIPTQHPSSYARLTTKLIISNVMDGDTFTCVATAGLKEQTASSTVFLEVDESPKLLTLEKLFNIPSKPVITSFYNEAIQEMGTSIILPCRVQSFADRQVFWQDPNGDFIYSNPRIRVLPSGDLMINGLRWADLGDWTCTAQNAFGNDSVTTFLYPAKRKQQ